MWVLTFFTNEGVPLTGLTPTLRIREVATGTLVVTDDSMSELGEGFYTYNFTDRDWEKSYAIRCDGGVTLPIKERYTVASTVDIGDAIDSKLSDTHGDSSWEGATASAVADAVWDEAIGGHQVAGSTGVILSTLTTMLSRVLGLVQENQYIDHVVADGRNVVSMRLRTYNTAEWVGTDNDVLAEYTITATYSGDILQTYKVVKN